jgi:hypothetical protein
VTYALVVILWVVGLVTPVAAPLLLPRRNQLVWYSVGASALVLSLWAAYGYLRSAAGYRPGLELAGLCGLTVLHAFGMASSWAREWFRVSAEPLAQVLWRISAAIGAVSPLAVLAVLTTNPFIGSVWKGWGLLAVSALVTIWAFVPLFAKGRQGSA